VNNLPVIRYNSAGGVVTDGDRVLVLVRPGRAGPEGRPEVRLPKGHVEPDESREETARREVGEEAGLLQAEIVADLGHQTVEFEWQERHIVRDESFFLMTPSPGALPGQTEGSLTQCGSPGEALLELTFEQSGSGCGGPTQRSRKFEDNVGRPAVVAADHVRLDQAVGAATRPHATTVGMAAHNVRYFGATDDFPAQCQVATVGIAQSSRPDRPAAAPGSQ